MNSLGVLSLSLSLADLWIMAAKCEMEDRNSSESARHLFLRALRFHPENQKVYQEVSDGDVSYGGKLPQTFGL